mmetsp:Transcript_13297/g.40222  ORF Transcript_13297/g.40222 Transcript_13297/m.40222 type:complete len:109 (+) Transcript_13297:2760-3086(+)
MSTEGWWIVQTTLSAWRDRARRCSAATHSVAMDESRPDVGSSSISADGSLTSSMAMLTRFRCPPETPLLSSRATIGTSAQISNRICRSKESTRASRSSGLNDVRSLAT